MDQTSSTETTVPNSSPPTTVNQVSTPEASVSQATTQPVSTNTESSTKSKKVIIAIIITAVIAGCCLITALLVFLGRDSLNSLIPGGKAGENFADEMDVLVDTVVLEILQQSDTALEIASDIDRSKLMANDGYKNLKSMEFSSTMELNYQLSESLAQNDPDVRSQMGNELGAILESKEGQFKMTTSGINDGLNPDKIEASALINASLSIPGTTVDAEASLVSSGQDAYITINRLPVVPDYDVQQYVGKTIHYSAEDLENEFGVVGSSMNQQQLIQEYYQTILRESGIKELNQEDVDKVKQVFRLPAVIDYITRLDNETIGNTKTECYNLSITKDTAPDLILGIGLIFVPEEVDPIKDRADIEQGIADAGFNSIDLISCFGKSDNLIHKLGFKLNINNSSGIFDVSGEVKAWNYNQDLVVNVPTGPYTELEDLAPPSGLDGFSGTSPITMTPDDTSTLYQTCLSAPNSIGCSACQYPSLYQGGKDYCGDCEAAYTAQLSGQDPTITEPDFDLYCK